MRSWRRLRTRIREWVTSGKFAPGDKLPSERTLLDEFGMGRTTVRLVLNRLADAGRISAQHGRGYFVNEPRS
ncbi:winged helix-turn-helix domain-containing protein [Nonomuraea soli]|uniref:DNA-binding GntR family transcriptional regulator n=1 Tax=Nonomuraea soli TaxID=1032476 RepID=A0A7W0CQ22_9ACTN|nr:winged helix-turn-helix domain-containing protein [Nonomuraea soli]MBA2895094.1 DNA-binding GntR family transcriptional regulator [Nonomuraea soli]